MLLQFYIHVFSDCNCLVCFQWGSNLNLLAANSVTTVLILCEHIMSAHFGQQVAAVQLTPSQLSLTMFNTNSHLTLRSDMHIKGVCVTKVTSPNICPVTKLTSPKMCPVSRHQGNQTKMGPATKETSQRCALLTNCVCIAQRFPNQGSGPHVGSPDLKMGSRDDCIKMII